MTTEIAIINRLGVALATDSAVTISGGGRTKVWDTADKLFELSPIHPIAIMINGNMDCLGVPWEILIKEFRSSRGSSERASVEEWMNDFLAYVQNHDSLDDNSASRSIRRISLAKVDYIQRMVRDRIEEIIEQSQPKPKKSGPQSTSQSCSFKS